MTTIKKEKLVAHPMEEVFNMEPGTTVVEYTEAMPTTIVLAPNYDEKDNEIEQKLEDIYASAMDNVSVISDTIETVEGKYKARVAEVTAAMLNVALGAVNAKANIKKHKDNLAVEMLHPDAPHTVNNNLVVTDRNELLKMLMKQAEDKNKV